jgi:regulatory protein
MREHSCAELARKLAPHAAAPEEVEALLADLVAQGWLSDERAAQSVVRRQSERLGLSRVKQALQAKGLASDVVAQATAGLADTELARALQVWQRKFGRPPADVAERAKHTRFLMGRGFGHDTIRAVLKQVVDQSPEG